METKRRTSNDASAADLWTWLTAISGIAFVLLAVAGFVISGNAPTPSDSFQTIRAYFVDHRTAVIASVYIDGISLAFFLAFASGLGGLLARGAADPLGILSRLMVAGAVGVVVITVVEDMAEAALAFRTAATGDTAAVQALFDFYMMVPLVSLCLAAFLVAAAIGIYRGSVLPHWMAWVAAIETVLLLIGAAGLGDPRGTIATVGFAGGYLPFLIWTLIASVSLIVRRSSIAVSQEPSSARHQDQALQSGS